MKRKRLYPNIEAERVRHGYTYDDLSRILGVGRKTLYNWISKGKIPQTKLIQMSDLFGVSTDYLLKTYQ